MAAFEKHFTLEEATALLPEIRKILERLQEARGKLVVDWETAAPVLRAAHQNGGGKEAHPYLQDLQGLNDRLRRLAELGVELKDLDKGLVDFPSWRGDREVFLCWHLGEETIAFWHDLDSGFAGRQPL